jgi:ClpP class serine protease
MPATNPVTGRPRQPARAVLNRIASEPWAITPGALREFIGVAARVNPDLGALQKTMAEPYKGAANGWVREGNVGILPVRGDIFRYADLFTYLCGGTTVEDLAYDFNAMLGDPAVEGIVLEVDSPGGMLAGIGEFADMIYRARGTKPIVAHVTNLGASAAYYIAAAADEVAISRAGMVGSIGVLMTWLDTSKMDEALGVEEIVIVSSQSPYKVPDVRNDEHRQRLQSYVDRHADIMIGDLGRFRDVTKTKVVEDFGRGDLLIGKAAVDAGMAARVATLEQTIRSVSSGRAAARIARDGPGPAADSANPPLSAATGTPGRPGRETSWAGSSGSGPVRARKIPLF